MIIGIGIDLVEIKRIEKACSKEHFVNRCFTKMEQELFHNNMRQAAGNYAVKEAVSKMFGTGVRGFSMDEIEVLRDELGKPTVSLYGKALELAKQLTITDIHVSISNTGDLVTAIVVGENRKV